MMGRFDSGPNTDVRCVGRDRFKVWLEPTVTPLGQFVVVTTLHPLDTVVRT